MGDYQKVKSTMEISVEITDYLQLLSPRCIDGRTRGKSIREINDVLQGRSKRTVSELLDDLRQKSKGWYPGGIQRFSQEIASFQAQKGRLTVPYTKSGNQEYAYEVFDFDPEYPLKIIDQKIYDRAVEDGFPPDFFRKSYFDAVTFYALPDHVDFNFSEFHNCTFAVCRINGARFDGTRIYDAIFHTCNLQHTTFFYATLACSHFEDSTLRAVSFQRATLNRCFVRDCGMESVNFLNAMLNGCAFGRVAPKNIKNLDTATITHSGATAEEVKELRHAIYKALQVPEAQPQQKRPRRSGPGR